MSGGSFDYLYSKFDQGQFIDRSLLDDLAAMGEYLDENGEHAASTEIAKVHQLLFKVVAAVDVVVNPSLIALLKSVEWWASNDIHRDDFKKQFAKYLEGGSNAK